MKAFLSFILCFIAITGMAQNQYRGTFTGNGSGLTNLNASNLSSGKVPLAQLTNANTNTWAASPPLLLVTNGNQVTVQTNGQPLNTSSLTGMDGSSWTNLNLASWGTTPYSQKFQLNNAAEYGTLGGIGHYVPIRNHSGTYLGQAGEFFPTNGAGNQIVWRIPVAMLQNSTTNLLTLNCWSSNCLTVTTGQMECFFDVYTNTTPSSNMTYFKIPLGSPANVTWSLPNLLDQQFTLTAILTNYIPAGMTIFGADFVVNNNSGDINKGFWLVDGWLTFFYH